MCVVSPLAGVLYMSHSGLGAAQGKVVMFNRRKSGKKYV